MRYSASEKLEIIELVEQSTLSVGRTLASIGIPRSTFYDWYGRYQDGGIEALEDGKPRPQRVRGGPFRSGSARLGRSQKDGLLLPPWGSTFVGGSRPSTRAKRSPAPALEGYTQGGPK